MTNQEILTAGGGILSAFITVGILVLTAEFIKKRFRKKDQIEIEQYERFEPDFRYCEFDLELKCHKYLITTSKALRLREKMIDKASTKLYRLVSDKINSRISYKENDDGELEFIVNEEMMAEVLVELQKENEVFRKLTE